MKQAQKQDFIFGTSSQLAREESPTYLRDLQQAMQASNVMFDELFDDPFKDMDDEPSAVAPRGRSRTSAQKGGLWSAGARDITGSLLDVETVDITDTPVTVQQQTPQKSIAAVPTDDDVWHDIKEGISLAPKTTIPNLATPSKPGPVEAAIRLELLSSPTCTSPIKVNSPKRPKPITSRSGPYHWPSCQEGKAV
jgi:hypothetical protein